MKRHRPSQSLVNQPPSVEGVPIQASLLTDSREQQLTKEQSADVSGYRRAAAQLVAAYRTCTERRVTEARSEQRMATRTVESNGKTGALIPQ